MVYTWTKGWFSNTLRLYKDIQPVGFLHIGEFSRTSFASIDSSEFVVVRQGLFSSTVKVYRKHTNELLATIVPNFMSSSASIVLASGRKIFWQSKGFFTKKWNVLEEGRELAVGSMAQQGEGNCGMVEDDPLLLVAAIYTANIHRVYRASFFIFFVVFFIVLLPTFLR